MLEFQGRRRTKSWLYSKTAVFVCLVIVAFLAHGTWKMYQRYSFTAIERQKIEMTAANLQQRRDMLANSLEMLNTGDGVERQIRDKFLVVKEGEYVVTIVDKTPVATTTEPVKHWWQKIFDF